MLKFWILFIFGTIETRQPNGCLSKLKDIKRAAIISFAIKSNTTIPKEAIENIDDSQTWGDERWNEEQCKVVAAQFQVPVNGKGMGKGRIASPDFNLFASQKWNITKPIEVEVNGGESMYKSTKEALDEIQQNSCIRFNIVNLASGPYYIRINEQQGDSCSGDSPVGQQLNGNQIRVKQCTTMPDYLSSVILHEVMHSLGFGHTHSRPDAPEYLDIQWNNIDADLAYNFVPGIYMSRIQGPFDYESIMMYQYNVMSQDGHSATMLPKKDTEKNKELMGNGVHLSKEDINSLNRVYCNIQSETYDVGCKDYSETCGVVIENGQCKTAYAKMECQRTCNVCSDTCGDKDPKCQYYAHYCDLNDEIRSDCKATCGLCNASVGTDDTEDEEQGCTDQARNCDQFMKSCNLSNMQQYCKKSCNLC